MNQQNPNQFFNEYLVEIWRELAEYLMRHPEKLTASYLTYWQDYLVLCREYYGNLQPIPLNLDWQTQLICNFLQRSYQLFAKHAAQFAEDLNITDEKERQKINFYTQQFINSLSPNNFASTNPEVWAKTLETQGKNLIDGFQQFQEDLHRGHGRLQILQTDLSRFILGKNIACTRGKIIYQNDLMQLIQYQNITTHVHAIPLLIIPPWINKYYILDLQPENSLVKWLVAEGYTVFMISWINPTESERDKEFADYLLQGPLAAMSIIETIVKHKQINMMGYCVGGTLLACLLAYLTQVKESHFVMSATFLTTLLDFSEPGELGIFIDERQITLIEAEMNRRGFLDGRIMAAVFNALRANDLIWSAFVQNYLLGEKPKPFDLLFWNADWTNVPRHVHQFYLRQMYLKNLLMQPKQIQLNGIGIDLQQITTPSYFLAAHDDHIVPWRSCYQSHLLLKVPNKFVLTNSGHVAGVINPPARNKYGYWLNPKATQNAEQFLHGAQFYPGSWWVDWEKWLKRYAGDEVLGDEIYHKMPALEEAPGSYVQRRLVDID